MWFIILYCCSVVLAQLVERSVLFPLNFLINFLQNQYSFPLICTAMLTPLEQPFSYNSFIMNLKLESISSPTWFYFFKNGFGFSMIDPDFLLLYMPSNFVFDNGCCDRYLAEYLEFTFFLERASYFVLGISDFASRSP